MNLGGLMIFNKVKNIIVNELGINPQKISLDTQLNKDLELDSLDAVEIIMSIESQFEIEISEEDFKQFYTIKDVVNCIEKLVEKKK
jgi:acyl carrier protein